MSFWADRKAAVAAEEQAEARAEAEAVLAERSDEDILAELGLPEPETIEDAQGLRAFLSDAVPARLKTRALRRFWRLNPVLANLDGLVEYGEDFTDSATVVENLQTTYQVGKGMLAHIEALARQSDPEEPASTEAAGDERVESAELPPENAAEPASEPAASSDAVGQPPTPEPEPAEEIASAPVRRMVFQFEEDVAGG